ncbi:MAG: DUF4270 domain-containing protein [Cytophagaceae bacterium]|jgi:hypothetical protein|nr:DUF4270 domain-containing protein [Cytophagaceae bacterium]
MNSLPNWLIKGLLVCSAGLIFFSCKKDNSTLKLPGESEIPANTLVSDTFSVQISSALVYSDFFTENLVRQNNAYLMVGGMQNATFGNCKLQAFVQLKLNTPFADLSGAVLDSSVLELDYDYAYGDTLQSQNLSVYALDQGFNTETTYRINSPSLSYSTLLGSKSFKATPATGTNIRIPISNSTYVNAILNGPKNNGDFVQQFKGIALVAPKDSGAVIRLNLSSSLSRLFIYYKQNGVSKTYSLTLSNERYYNLSVDRSLSPLSGLAGEYSSVPSSSASNKTYYQGITGLRTKISFPEIEKLTSKLGNIFIHKAELVIPASGSNKADSLFLVKSNANGEIIVTNGLVATIQQSERSVDDFIYTQFSPYYSNEGVYKFQLGKYLQSIIYNELDNHALYLTPTKNSLEIDGGFLVDQSIPSSGIKLKIYYTKTN